MNIHKNESQLKWFIFCFEIFILEKVNLFYLFICLIFRYLFSENTEKNN